ncbi:MAG: phytanoyl-CoA dioxygenase family protein [Armatimonadetes bacterium]|nr:phytanoyl-CoA dioxygenase family protein [Armatimonadota bacterium]
MRDRFEDSTALLDDPPALRARAARDGYLFFRRLLPAEALLAVRADLLDIVRRHGWLAPTADPLEGRIDASALSAVPEAQMRTDIGVSSAAYDDVQRTESVHRLPHHPKLLALYRALFGGEVLVHARHIVRLITPHPSVYPTPQHQDFPLIQGTANTWTCWFPVGACPMTLGSLMVLRGSHRLGYLPIEPAKGAGGIAAQTCRGEVDWVDGDFELGDVLTFSAYMVHRAKRCRFKDRIRLSFDVRYQALAEPVEQRSLLPHCELTWEQVYADWRSDALKYYWTDLPLQLVPFDDTLLQPSRRIC